MWVLTTWYSLGLFLWQSLVLESGLPLRRLRAWSLKEHLLSFFSCLTPVHSQWGLLWPEGHWHYQTAGACCCWQGQRAVGSIHHTSLCSARTDLKSGPIPAPSYQSTTPHRAVENLEVLQLPCGSALAAPYARRRSSELPTWHCQLRPGTQAQVGLSPTLFVFQKSFLMKWNEPRARGRSTLTPVENILRLRLSPHSPNTHTHTHTHPPTHTLFKSKSREWCNW